jgi:hypothetical protein
MAPKWKTKKSIKTCFLVVSDHFSKKNRPNNLVRGLFLSLDIRPNVSPTCGPLGIFFGPYGGAQMAPNKQHENLFSGSFGQFLLKEWA